MFSRRATVLLLCLVGAVCVALLLRNTSLLTGQQGSFSPGNCNGNGVCDPDEGYYTCERDCPTKPCGDGYCDSRESDLTGPHACKADCVKNSPPCGNGWVDVGEQCDDGNVKPDDGCSATCKKECGDGKIQGKETCDDKNQIPGDGCSATCTKECGDKIWDTNPVDGYFEVCDGQQGCTAECTWKKQPPIGLQLPQEPLKPVCKPLDPEFNDAEADRVNVMFVGVGVTGTGALQEALQVSADQLFEREPFKSQTTKVQFWYHPDIAPLGDTVNDWEKTCMENCHSDAQCPELSNVNRNLICARECRSHAFFNGDAHVSYPDIMSIWRFLGGSVFVHEFGHQFGLLADEYVEADVGGTWTKKPNCAPDTATARRWWGSLVNDGSKTGYPIDYFGGCSYVAKHVRPTESSVMLNGFHGYGPVNEAWIADILKAYSGFSPNGKNERDVDEPPASELAWEIEWERQADGWAILSEKAVNVPFGVKPTMESGMEATVQIGERTYTQTFATEDVGIGEHLNQDGSFDHGGITRVPRNRITVQVGLGTTTLEEIGKQKPSVTVAPCNDNDAASNNDCAPPMYRGNILVPPVKQLPSTSQSSSRSSSSQSSLPPSSSSRSSLMSSSMQPVVITVPRLSSSRAAIVPTSSPVHSSIASLPRSSSVSFVGSLPSSRMSLALNMQALLSSPSSESPYQAAPIVAQLPPLPPAPPMPQVIYPPSSVPHAPVGQTGPASAAIVAAGAASGIAFVRRKRQRSQP